MRLYLFFALLFAPVVALATQPPIYTNEAGLGAGGYDVLTYFADKPQKGNPAYTAEWNGASWQFVSAAHRDTFLREPARYAPQFGGYCAWAVSNNYTAPTDPLAFSVVNDRLYLNYNKIVRFMWARNPQKNIAQGEQNWPAVLAQEQ